MGLLQWENSMCRRGTYGTSYFWINCNKAYKFFLGLPACFLPNLGPRKGQIMHESYDHPIAFSPVRKLSHFAIQYNTEWTLQKMERKIGHHSWFPEVYIIVRKVGMDELKIIQSRPEKQHTWRYKGGELTGEELTTSIWGSCRGFPAEVIQLLKNGWLFLPSCLPSFLYSFIPQIFLNSYYVPVIVVGAILQDHAVLWWRQILSKLSYFLLWTYINVLRKIIGLLWAHIQLYEQ